MNTPYGRLRDINGDGIPDRVEDYWAAINSITAGIPYTPYTNFEVQLSTGEGFSGVTAWPVSSGPLTVEDANSPDYYNVESGGVNVGLFDINGDGRPDRVMAAWGGGVNAVMTNFMVQLNTGTNFGPPVVYGPYHSQNWNGSYPPQANPYNWAGIQAPEAQMIDINGDGLPDRLMWPMNPTNGFVGQPLPNPASFYAVEYNDGYSFESTNTSTNVPGAFDVWPGVVAQANNGQIVYNDTKFLSDSFSDLPFEGMYDVNGDGLPDRVVLDQASLGTSSTIRYVYLNNGHGLNTNAIVVNNIANEGQYAVYNGSTEDAWWSPEGYGNSSSVNAGSEVTTMIDINGDGLLDRVLAVYYNPDGNPTANYFLVQLNQGPFPDLLTNINNGIGGNISVTYKASTAYDNRVDTTNPNSVSHLPYPQQVTASVTESDGVNPPQTTTYSYTGGFYDGVRREFHGFAAVTNTDPTSRTTVTYFHTGGGRNYSTLGEYQDTNPTTGAGNFAKSGMAYRVETYGNDG